MDVGGAAKEHFSPLSEGLLRISTDYALGHKIISEPYGNLLQCSTSLAHKTQNPLQVGISEETSLMILKHV